MKKKKLSHSLMQECPWGKTKHTKAYTYGPTPSMNV